MGIFRNLQNKINKKMKYLITDIIKANIGINKQFKLNLNITNSCNLKCQTCNIWEKENNEININKLEYFLKKNNHFSWIDITGGEIFLHKNITEIFSLITKYCKRLNVIHFPTNGYNTQQIIEETQKLKKIFKKKLIISVSLDGTEKIHNLQRGNKNSYQNALNTYKKFNQINKNTFIGYTISEYNIKHFKEFLAEMKKHNISANKIHINLAQSSDYYNKIINQPTNQKRNS